MAARILEYEPAARRYRLPAEHAAFLTKAARTNNLAAQMIMVSCMAEVEPKVIEAFRKGGGVPYSAYSRFTESMKAVSAEVFDETLVQRTLPLVPGLVARARARHRRPRRRLRLRSRHQRHGEGVSEVAVHRLRLLAGRDRRRAAPRRARLGLENARFELVDVASIKDRQRFDFITAFDAIHDQAKPRQVLAGIARALRRDGVFLMVDIRASSALEENLDHPMGPMLYGVSTLHCMTVSLALDGEGLGTVVGRAEGARAAARSGVRRPRSASGRGRHHQQLLRHAAGVTCASAWGDKLAPYSRFASPALRAA